MTYFPVLSNKIKTIKKEMMEEISEFRKNRKEFILNFITPFSANNGTLL